VALRVLMGRADADVTGMLRVGAIVIACCHIRLREMETSISGIASSNMPMSSVRTFAVPARVLLSGAGLHQASLIVTTKMRYPRTNQVRDVSQVGPRL